MDGLEQRVCGLCGNVETRTIPKNDEQRLRQYVNEVRNTYTDRV